MFRILMFLTFAIASASAYAQTYVDFRKGLNAWGVLTLPKKSDVNDEAYIKSPFGLNKSLFNNSDFTRVKEQGFDFVRLPVDPSPFLASDEKEWADLSNHVKQSVDAALAAKLSVILDVHPPVSQKKWNIDTIIESYSKGDSDELAEKFSRLNVLFARLLADRDVARLALEPMNEPGLTCNPNSLTKVIRAFNEIALNVRKVSGSLRLVFEPSCQSSGKLLIKLDPKLINDQLVIYSFHFYEPFLFTHQGSTWSYRHKYLKYLKDVPYPATPEAISRSVERSISNVRKAQGLLSNDREGQQNEISAAVTGARLDKQSDVIETSFNSISSWAGRHGIPKKNILLGEFGTLKPADNSGPSETDRARWISDVRVAAESRGFAWAIWEYVDVMGIVNSESDRTLIPSVQRALGLNAGK